MGMHGIRCPYCRSKDVVKNGFYRYKSNAEQRYRCKSCGKSFTERSKSPFKGMRHSPGVILFAIRLYTEFYLSSNECSSLHPIFRGYQWSWIQEKTWKDGISFYDI